MVYVVTRSFNAHSYFTLRAVVSPQDATLRKGAKRPVEKPLLAGYSFLCSCTHVCSPSFTLDANER